VAALAIRWLMHPSDRISAGDQRLHRVADGVFFYRGYFSNSCVLELPEGLVVVDTQVSPIGARHLREEIAAVSSKPIVLVVNTHYHGDHTGGNAVFDGIETIGSELTARYCHERDEERVQYANTFGLAFQEVHPTLAPTRTFRDRLELNIAGDTIVIAQIGASETPDCSVVWWPRRRIVCAGDGVATIDYPFLGVPFMDEGLRPDGDWIRFLTTIRDWKPEILLPGHGPAIVSEAAIRSRLDLLVELFTSLMDATKRAMAKQLAVDAIVAEVDRDLARYREHPELAAVIVSQRFAIYRCINNLSHGRAGKGWWNDLRPSIVARAPRASVEGWAREAKSTDAIVGRSRALVKGKRRDAAIALLECWIESHDRDARALAELADTLFDGAAGVRPKVDATEFFAEATKVVHRAIAIDGDEPLANLVLGCAEVFGGMVLSQPMQAGVAKIERALKSPTLTSRQRTKGLFFLAKAHQHEHRDSEADASFRAMLPAWLRWSFPLLRARLRRLP
ncbi:MAG: MBL fold metallo-hydrolase, partial [Polyangiales bacterium]